MGPVEARSIVDAFLAGGATGADGREREAADMLRGGTREDRRRTYGAYATLSDSLDPADPADAARLDWLVHNLSLAERRPDPRVENLLSRLSAAPGPRALVFAARIVCGQEARERGDDAGAERAYRAVLKEVRGEGSEAERAVLSNLSLLFQTQGRELESLLLSRRVERLAEAAGDDWGLAITRARIATTLRSLDDKPRWATAVDAVEAVVPRLDEEKREPLRLSLIAHRFHRLLDEGQADEALALLDQAEADFPPDGSLARDLRVGGTLRARGLLAAGRPEQALAVAEACIAAGSKSDARGVGLREILVRAVLETDGADAALPHALDLLATLESDSRPGPGTGILLDIGFRLAHLLEDDCGAPDGAQRALDLAAGAAIRRILEVERCLVDFPELAEVAEGDRDILEDARKRFRGRQEEIGDAAVRLFGRTKVPGEERIAGLLAPGQIVCACAWCRRVRLPTGNWVPVGLFLPPEGRLKVTHGICPPCREALAPAKPY